MDPDDVRRGPSAPDEWPYNPHPGNEPIIVSPFYRQADLCGTCHDVSNPVFSLQPDGSYAPNALDQPHPSMDKYEMFPVERTFSEWSQSQFAAGGVQAEHRVADGVTCNFCHRLVDPNYTPGESPDEDIPIIASLLAQDLLPFQFGSAQYVVDPDDVRRGPSAPDEWPYNPHPGNEPIIVSPFYRQADLCGTCHDVSNPVFSLQPDGSYAPNALDQPHPSMDKYEMFPVERTFSEWSQSQFAAGGVQLDGRFGGEHATGVMETCQDCHMPDRVGPGCNVGGFPIHPDLPQHAFNGGNTWVLDAIRTLYDDFETGLHADVVADSLARALEMLQNASDMELTIAEDLLSVRIINYTGHKLPTGYPEGRRMWLNVQFFDDQEELIIEHGAYDSEFLLVPKPVRCRRRATRRALRRRARHRRHGDLPGLPHARPRRTGVQRGRLSDSPRLASARL